MSVEQQRLIAQSVFDRKAAKAMTWTREWRARATAEGWYLWFYSDHRTGRAMAEIHRKRDANCNRWAPNDRRLVRWATDREANDLVAQLAEAGAHHAKLALVIIARLTILNV